jgi:hypothetical protein
MAAQKGNNYSALRKTNPTYTDEQIDKICDDLLEWAHSGEGIWLASYIYENYKRSPAWLNQLGEHHPEVKEALAIAKELIGGKVGNHCWIGDRNSAFGEKILPMYSKEYKDETERKAKLTKNDLTEQDAQLIVNAVNYAKKQNG